MPRHNEGEGIAAPEALFLLIIECTVVVIEVVVVVIGVMIVGLDCMVVLPPRKVPRRELELPP